MSTTDPVTVETRRFSTWMLRAALFLALPGLFALQSQGRPPLDDADGLKDRAPMRLGEELVEIQAQVQEGANPASEPMNARRQAFNIAIFGQGLNAPDARTVLEARLAEKIASVDRICGLTRVQNQRLQLAGRGDIKRFLDRLDSLQAQIQEGPDTDDEKERAWADRLNVEAAGIRRALNSGVFEAGSLFTKVLKKTLTTDQALAWDKAPPLPPAIGVIRWIDPIGGKVWIAAGDGGGVKPRMTYHIRKKPLARQMPGKPDVAPAEDGINGAIEVTRVLGENLSEARILSEDVADRIAKGDAVVPWRPRDR
jgi:hypothetical protein